MKLKREQIKKYLRKEQIEKQFNERRKLLMGAIEQQQYREQPVHLFQSILDNTLFNLRQKNVQPCLQNFGHLIRYVQEDPDASTLVFIHSSKVSQLIELVLRNQPVEQNNYSYELLSPQLQTQLTDYILTLLNSVNYSALNQETFFTVVKSFWLILQLKNIEVESASGLQLLDKTLQIIIKMMNPPNEIVYHRLKELGIGSKIVELIEDRRLVQKNRFCELLSEIIYLYLQHEIMFEVQKNCEINGVHILGMQSHEKQKLLAFCLALINMNDPKMVENSLNAIANIIQRFEYFADSIPQETLRKICQLMDSSERKIQHRAMELMDMIIYENNNNSLDKLVTNMFIIDLIDKQLRKEAYHQDALTKSIVQRCTVMLCNLTLVKDLKLKKKLSQHPVWDFAYHQIRTDSYMFPLVIVFQYFFQILPRQKMMNIVEAYVQKVSELQMSVIEQKYKQSITSTIRRLFYLFNEYFHEDMIQRYLVLLQSNKLTYLISQEIQTYKQEQL